MPPNRTAKTNKLTVFVFCFSSTTTLPETPSWNYRGPHQSRGRRASPSTFCCASELVRSSCRGAAILTVTKTTDEPRALLEQGPRLQVFGRESTALDATPLSSTSGSQSASTKTHVGWARHTLRCERSLFWAAAASWSWRCAGLGRLGRRRRLAEVEGPASHRSCARERPNSTQATNSCNTAWRS